MKVELKPCRSFDRNISWFVEITFPKRHREVLFFQNTRAGVQRDIRKLIGRLPRLLKRTPKRKTR